VLKSISKAWRLPLLKLKLRKERFLGQRKSKLQPRGDDHFQVLERINDNAYKVDLPSEYGVSVTLNVSDLSFLDVENYFQHLRANTFQERGNDVDI